MIDKSKVLEACDAKGKAAVDIAREYEKINPPSWLRRLLRDCFNAGGPAYDVTPVLETLVREGMLEREYVRVTKTDLNGVRHEGVGMHLYRFSVPRTALKADMQLV